MINPKEFCRIVKFLRLYSKREDQSKMKLKQNNAVILILRRKNDF